MFANETVRPILPAAHRFLTFTGEDEFYQLCFLRINVHNRLGSNDIKDIGFFDEIIASLPLLIIVPCSINSLL